MRRRLVRGTCLRGPAGRRVALSLLEITAVVTILGILALVVVPRFGSHAHEAKKRGCALHRGNIEIQCQLWYRNKGSWPNSSLSDIGANPAYFPEGLPSCPADGSAYTFDAATQTVTGHAH